MEESKRVAKESPLLQGVSEQILYSLDTAPWGGTPVVSSIKAYDATGVDVSATVLTGGSSVNGNVITLPKLKSLTAGAIYTVKILFTSGGNTLEAKFVVIGDA